MTTKTRLSWSTWLDQGLRPEVLRYREDLMDRIFPPFLLFGFAALSIGAWRAIHDGQWRFAVAYLSCYLLIAALGLKRLSVGMRSRLMLIGLLAIAVVGLIRLGLGGVGTLVLVAWCGLTGLLRGFRASLVAVVVSLVAIAVTGAAVIGGLISMPSEQLHTSMIPGAWVANAVTFAAITAGLIVPLKLP